MNFKSKVDLYPGSTINGSPLTSGGDLTAHENSSSLHLQIGERDAWNAKETVIGSQAKVNAHANLTTNPHGVTKAQVGLGSVSNVLQASKSEFDAHVSVFSNHASTANSHMGDNVLHITSAERSKWNTHTHDDRYYTEAEMNSFLAGKMYYGDVVMNTNPFGGKKLYINSINNAIFRAESRWNVTAAIYNANGTVRTSMSEAEAGALFNGSYESGIIIPAGCYLKVNIEFNGGQFPGYPYGFFYLSHYHTNHTASAKLRVYSNFESHGIGWHEMNFSDYVKNGSDMISVARNDKYAISQMEFTITAPVGASATVSQIDWQLDRPGNSEMPILDKFNSNSLYSSLAFKNINNVTTASISEAGTGDFSALRVNGTNVSTDGHTHDDRYYTETEMNSLLSGKSATSHTHTFASLTSRPTTLSGFGITDAYTKLETNSEIGARISALVNSAPGTLDTLNELANALGGDPNFATTVSSQISTKAEKTITLTGGTGITTVIGDLSASRTISIDATVARKDARSDGYHWMRRASTAPPLYVTQQASGPIAQFMQGAGDGSVRSEIANDGQFTGNAYTASKWLTPSALTIGGDATGNVSIDGSADATLTIEVKDDSHNHTILRAKDKRTPKPSDYSTSTTGLETIFTSLDVNGTTPYADALILSNYPDASGGGINMLAFRKDKGEIYHRFGAWNGAAWEGYRKVAYTDEINWNNLAGIPSSFIPSTHHHDDRYYLKTETDGLLNGKSNTNHNHTLDSLSDTLMTSKLTNHFLKWNGSKWINSSIAATDVPSLDTSKITTGVFGTARLPSATTSAAGIVQLNDATNSTSVVQAATANAVKKTYDLADAAFPKAGGIVTGATTFRSTVTIDGNLNVNGLHIGMANDVDVIVANDANNESRAGYYAAADSLTFQMDSNKANTVVKTGHVDVETVYASSKVGVGGFSIEYNPTENSIDFILT